MKILLVCLTLVLSVGAAHAEETHLQGFDRFGRRVSAVNDQQAFPYIMARGEARGFLGLARTGSINSIAPYDHENGKRVVRPGEVDDLIYETLMFEDPLRRSDRLFPLIAQAVRVPADYSYVVFEIAPGARFNDGVEVSSSEIFQSYLIYKLSTPELTNYFAAVVKDIVPGIQEIRFSLNVTGQKARDAIMLLAKMKVLKANTTGNPLMGGIPVRYTGTGPYTITQLSPGKISFLRNQFYWGSVLPARKGFFNFRQIDITAFTNQEAIAGDLGRSTLNYYIEDRQPAVKDLSDRLSNIVSTISPRSESRAHSREAKSSFAFNVSRPFIADVRVRKALVLAFDFDLINQVYHLGQLKRPASLLDGSAIAPTGTPSPGVQNILQSCELPNWKLDAFENYGNRLYARIPDKRTRLLHVMGVFREAGYSLIDGKLTFIDEHGRKFPLKLKLLSWGTAAVNQLIFYKNELYKLGIDAEVITPVSRAEYEALLASGDYDLAPSEERLMSQDLIPRADLARELFAAQQTGPGRAGTVALNRLNSPCVERILDAMDVSIVSTSTYFDYAQALARVQQILYLNIFAGDAKTTNFYLDRRLSVPGPLSFLGMVRYGYWDGGNKE